MSATSNPITFSDTLEKYKYFAEVYKAKIQVLDNGAYSFYLAAGSFGKVYLVYDPEHDKILIEKILIVKDGVEYKNALYELSYLYFLKKHCAKFITCVYSVIISVPSEGLNQINIYSEFIGFSLESYMEKNRDTLPTGDYVIIMNRILEAMIYLHQLGVAHRDIKPGNIVINPSTLEVKFIDFGISCFKDPEKVNKEYSIANRALLSTTRDQMNTCYIQIKGSPLYMSPELLSDKVKTFEDLARCDLWALGVTFYWLILGEYPFNSTSFGGLIYDMMTKLQKFETVGAIYEECLLRKSGTLSRYIEERIDFFALMYITLNDMMKVNPAEREDPEVILQILKIFSLKLLTRRDVDASEIDDVYEAFITKYINSRKIKVAKDTKILTDNIGLSGTVTNSAKMTKELKKILSSKAFE